MMAERGIPLEFAGEKGMVRLLNESDCDELSRSGEKLLKEMLKAIQKRTVTLGCGAGCINYGDLEDAIRRLKKARQLIIVD
jgi:hypothetical protein